MYTKWKKYYGIAVTGDCDSTCGRLAWVEGISVWTYIQKKKINIKLYDCINPQLHVFA